MILVEVECVNNPGYEIVCSGQNPFPLYPPCARSAEVVFPGVACHTWYRVEPFSYSYYGTFDGVSTGDPILISCLDPCHRIDIVTGERDETCPNPDLLPDDFWPDSEASDDTIGSGGGSFGGDDTLPLPSYPEPPGGSVGDGPIEP